ncbi:MAG: protein kinase [Polyangiaceae bacterium]
MTAPRRLGDFEVQRRIGSGGMAEVFLATKRGAKGTEKRLVVKRLHPEHARSERLRSMFVAEAHLAMRLAHSNLVHVYELTDDPDGGLLLSMEYVDGADLARILTELKQRDERLPLPVALRIVEQAARGLHHAHEHTDDGAQPLAIVHRDISPQNILIARSGVVKVADLGVASARFVRDETGVQPGKLRYMSPEQARGEKVDRRCDIYALGIVLYELLRLQSPYGELRGTTLARAVREGRIKPAVAKLDDIPPDIAPILQAALAPDLAARTPTARDLADALSRVLFDRRAHVDDAELQAALAPYMDAAAERTSFIAPAPVPPRASASAAASSSASPPTADTPPADATVAAAPRALARDGPPSAPSSLRPGDHFDRYILDARIGRGGMADVFRARDTRLGRDIALKLLRGGSGGASRERMLVEAQAAATFEHPGSVVIYDVGEHQGRPFIAMELIRGRTLATYLGDASTPLSRRLRWSVDIARVLAAAHRNGLIHRDVKPSNVMIRDDGEVKVLDFGIVHRRLTDLSSSTGAPALTAAGAIVGTPGYAAPEQLLGDIVDGRADQFSWAVTTYELLAGRRPWTADTTGDLVTRTLFQPFEPLRTLAPDTPPPVAAAIERALSRERDLRFPTLEAAAAALTPFTEPDLTPGAPHPVRSTLPPVAESGERPAATLSPPSTANSDGTPRPERASSSDIAPTDANKGGVSSPIPPPMLRPSRSFRRPCFPEPAPSPSPLLPRARAPVRPARTPPEAASRPVVAWQSPPSSQPPFFLALRVPGCSPARRLAARPTPRPHRPVPSSPRSDAPPPPSREREPPTRTSPAPWASAPAPASPSSSASPGPTPPPPPSSKPASSSPPPPPR